MDLVEEKMNLPPSTYYPSTVLYVEDNRHNMELMQEIFKSLFKEVRLLTASTAEEGLTITDTEQLDLVMMDIDLPGIDGFEALETLRKTYSKENLPIIAVSAHATKGQIQKGLDAGFLEYVAKPIDLLQLKQTLLNYLHTSQ